MALGLAPLAGYLVGLNVLVILAGLAAIAAEFLKLGVVVFGRGYVLLAFLRRDLAGPAGWLPTRQVLAGAAVGIAHILL